MQKSILISLFSVIYLFGCGEQKLNSLPWIHSKSPSEQQSYQQLVCKGYSHVVGPTEMYCIAAESRTLKKGAKAASITSQHQNR